jgi:predicted DNA-binding transcriptional regulator AlpA
MSVITLNIDVGELASALADQLAQRGLVVPQQPAELPDPAEIWSARQVREYLGISTSTFYERRKTPGFPGLVDRPGQPRWRASEVRAWAAGK